MHRRRAHFTRDPERCREDILVAAFARFARHGYRLARMSDVAHDAGYSGSQVFYHFRTKAALFREVVSRLAATTLAPPTDDAPEAIVGRLHATELTFHADARWRGLDRVWSEALEGEHDVLDLLKAHLGRTVSQLEEQLGRVDRVDHPERRQLALLVLAVSYGVRTMRRHDPDVLSPEEAAELVARVARAALAELGNPTA